MIWLNLICLDAPLVAVAWQWLFARSLDATVSVPARLGLFLTAWLIYLGDRFATATSLSDGVPKSAREIFCRTNRRFWIGLILVVALIDGIVVLRWLDAAILRRGMFLALIAGVYLVVNLRFRQVWRIIPVKEISVGFLFAAGTLLMFMPQLRAARWTLDFAVFLFTSLCALNCISIAVWECPLDLAQSRHSIATRWPGISIWARTSLIGLFCFSALLEFIDGSLGGFAFCLGLSSALLFALYFLPLKEDTRTAFADLVLLTPLGLFAAEYFM